MARTKAPRLDEVQPDAEYGYSTSTYGGAFGSVLVRVVGVESIAETSTFGGKRTGRMVRRVHVVLLEDEKHSNAKTGEHKYIEAKHLRYSTDAVREERAAFTTAAAARTKLLAALRLRGLDADEMVDASWRDSDRIGMTMTADEATALAVALIEPVDPA